MGTDYTSGLHDDPEVVREMQQLDGSIDKIRSILKNSDVLPQRTDADQIDEGNRVKIKFEDEDAEEMYRVGTVIDASYASDESSWVSIESPLGKELKGKRKGEIVTYPGLQDTNAILSDAYNERGKERRPTVHYIGGQRNFLTLFFSYVIFWSA